MPFCALYLEFSNSSSFSAILRSISCLTWASSRAALNTYHRSNEDAYEKRFYLVLLLFKRAFGLFKGTLQLLLLDLKPPPLFVQLVNGAATIAKLVEQILDLFGEVLVLPANNVQLLVGVLKGGLEAVHLRAIVAALALARLQLGHQVVGLGLPLSKHPVKVVAPLLGDGGCRMDALVFL